MFLNNENVNKPSLRNLTGFISNEDGFEAIVKDLESWEAYQEALKNETLDKEQYLSFEPQVIFASSNYGLEVKRGTSVSKVMNQLGLEFDSFSGYSVTWDQEPILVRRSWVRKEGIDAGQLGCAIIFTDKKDAIVEIRFEDGHQESWSEYLGIDLT